ncbi:MAG: hypothetical protein OHK93_003191 [Ramalina farinacea]|uniref:Calcipressin-domain-containing protein n=1 Tax=Ramalina farinacea TaxID=258253 RepID=A0AA43QSX8_9LECA|nr:hypothetical protein [Ramalina farinacea]
MAMCREAKRLGLSKMIERSGRYFTLLPMYNYAIQKKTAENCPGRGRALGGMRRKPQNHRDAAPQGSYQQQTPPPPPPPYPWTSPPSPLLWPSPPSNTLLITQLNNPATFHGASLEKIRDLLSSPTPLNSFSPLRSLRRIIVSYPTIEAACAARELLESPGALPLASSLSSPASHANTTTTTTTTYGEKQQQQQQQQKMKIYFGSPTPILGAGGSQEDQHLHPPAMGKLLFISPPPSPPCGWEIREEEPPNKETHAEDLQRALAGLGGGGGGGSNFEHDGSDEGEDMEEEEEGMGGERSVDDYEEGNEEEELDGFGKRKTEGTRARDVRARRKSLTTMVYHPRDHGDREDLPAVMVEDMSGAVGGVGRGEGEGGDDDDGEGGEGKKIMAHTARPPVELMEG